MFLYYEVNFDWVKKIGLSFDFQFWLLSTFIFWLRLWESWNKLIEFFNNLNVFLLKKMSQRHIHKPVKHLRWSVLRKKLVVWKRLTIFVKRSILDDLQGSECGSIFFFQNWLIPRDNLVFKFDGSNFSS